MSDFRPGVAAARKALGGAVPIVHNRHPGGAAGVKLSLQEVAARIRKGRNDPRVRAWAIRSVKAAGGPQDFKSQAQAILSALKDATVYVQDPVNTEFIQAAHETLCLDDKGLCFRGGDCDDLVVAYGSATLAIGIPTQIIGMCFKNDPVPSHVLAAIKDNQGNWHRVDPSTDKPVGDYVWGTKEEWIDPMASSSFTGIGDASGDFVGVGFIPTDHHLGLGAAAPTPVVDPARIAVVSGIVSLGVIGGLIYLMSTKKDY